MGNCAFTEKGIILDFQSDSLTLVGTLNFERLSPIRYDIMEPFNLVPFMQCRHSIYSMLHRINGQITINDQHFEFINGIGYIKGDRGRSFPKQYIWTQCSFENNSLMLSVADIPFHGNMCRTIHESAVFKAYYCFSHKDRVLCEFTSDKASFEFEYD